jgi:leucyl-tRNA---protein transferase
MSNSESLTARTIRLYRTSEHSCSYLADRESRTLFLDPDLSYDASLYEELTHSGFRRSGKYLYKPDCRSCQSCIATRIPINEFKLSRRFRRVQQKNQDISFELNRAKYRDKDYRLFERYIEQRHHDGDMYPASPSSYGDFLAMDTDFSFHIRYFIEERLIGVAVTDQLLSGLSAIYTFFDPDLNQRSLGVFSVLTQINICRSLNLPYLYLGYWVPGCAKMNYKTDYKPIELLINNQWQRMKQL